MYFLFLQHPLQLKVLSKNESFLRPHAQRPCYVEARLQKPAHLNSPKNKLASRKMKRIVNTSGINGDNELSLNAANFKMKSIKENATYEQCKRNKEKLGVNPLNKFEGKSLSFEGAHKVKVKVKFIRNGL